MSGEASLTITSLNKVYGKELIHMADVSEQVVPYNGQQSTLTVEVGDRSVICEMCAVITHTGWSVDLNTLPILRSFSSSPSLCPSSLVVLGRAVIIGDSGDG